MKIGFLYNFIHQPIYVELPKKTKIESTKNMICKLFKAFYGLKQSFCLWYKCFLRFFLNILGLLYIHANYGIFYLNRGL